MFTDAEIAYLTAQPLGRLATVGPGGRPHVTPVGVFHDRETGTVVIGSVADMTRAPAGLGEPPPPVTPVGRRP